MSPTSHGGLCLVMLHLIPGPRMLCSPNASGPIPFRVERETEKGAIRNSGFEAPKPRTVAHSARLVRLSSAIGFLLSHRCGPRTFCLSPQIPGHGREPVRTIIAASSAVLHKQPDPQVFGLKSRGLFVGSVVSLFDDQKRPTAWRDTLFRRPRQLGPAPNRLTESVWRARP